MKKTKLVLIVLPCLPLLYGIICLYTNDGDTVQNMMSKFETFGTDFHLIERRILISLLRRVKFVKVVVVKVGGGGI